MEIQHKPITTQEQFEAVAARIEQLKDAEAGSGQAMELKLLTKLIVEYASKDRGNIASPEQSQMA